ncbi:hypothetical protein [Paenibacillus sp. Y412MC10]|uniref:hypothetical protein n=2 Tax=Paenibacillus TaxID=44249 RepID=UPI0011AB6100|nr:hypothetical protein [Paenibacillus sp. Y412MC10]
MRHLETALELDDSRVFSDYAVWLNGILNNYGMETHTLTDNFRYLSNLFPQWMNWTSPLSGPSAST